MIAFTFPKDSAIKFPDFCCCCGQAIPAVQPGPAQTDAASRSPSNNVAVPICAECETHMQKSVRTQRWMEKVVGGGTISAVMLALVMFSNKYDFGRLKTGQFLVLLLSFLGVLLLVLGVPLTIMAVFFRPHLQAPHLPGSTIPLSRRFRRMAHFS